MSNIHPLSVVDSRAEIADTAVIGPYCRIGPNVVIDEDTIIQSHAVIDGKTYIGRKCLIYPFVSIGLEPQDVKFKNEETKVYIGNNNIIRENVTIHKGTSKGNGETRIGDNNFIMAYSHIAHDCIVGSNVIFVNLVSLGGHVIVEDCAAIGAYSGVHQFCRVGKYSFVGAYTAVTQDVLPFSIVAGNRAKLYGINSIGLHRHNFEKQRINLIKKSLSIIKRMNIKNAIETLAKNYPENEDVQYIIDFIKKSNRGVIK